jgi:citrate lyase subunit beta / citryl-CoA lyase
MPAAGLHAQAAGGVMRSLLFVPGDSARKLEKGLNSGADALIVDLEDSVAPSGKAAARQVAAAFLAEARAQASRPRLFVRVNGLETGLADADLDGVMGAGPDGIMLPKTVGGPDVSHLGSKLAVREAAFGLEDGATRIVAIATESARGVFALGTLAGASRRLSGITWGGEDLSADIGAEANRREDGSYADPYRLARALTLLAAAAAEVDAIDSVYTNFRDLDGLAAECRHARRDGFVAKMAIHPAQVPVINEAFTPSADAVAWAHSVIDAFAAQPDAGVVGMKGEMLDRPHLKRAQRLVRRMADAGRRPANPPSDG